MTKNEFMNCEKMIYIGQDADNINDRLTPDEFLRREYAEGSFDRAVMCGVMTLCADRETFYRIFVRLRQLSSELLFTDTAFLMGERTQSSHYLALDVLSQCGVYGDGIKTLLIPTEVKRLASRAGWVISDEFIEKSSENALDTVDRALSEAPMCVMTSDMPEAASALIKTRLAELFELRMDEAIPLDKFGFYAK
ncbi:MAG: hypothetical protein WCQ72_06745 [Eubacteriales bacterium]